MYAAASDAFNVNRSCKEEACNGETRIAAGMVASHGDVTWPVSMQTAATRRRLAMGISRIEWTTGRDAGITVDLRRPSLEVDGNFHTSRWAKGHYKAKCVLWKLLFYLLRSRAILI